MSTLNKGLAVAAILLAGSTIYLAWRVGVEPERAPAAQLAAGPGHADGSGSSTDAAEMGERNFRASRTPADSPVASSPVAIPRGRGGRAPREVAAAIDRQTFELTYRDSATRRQLVEELVPDLRDDYLILERRLKLGDARWQEFLEALAAQRIDQRARTAGCAGNPECLRGTFSADRNSQEEQALIALLGDAGHEAYKEFSLSVPERRGVASFQNRLPLPQRLSETAAEELVMALSEVRRDSEAEIYAAGGAVTRFLFGETPPVTMPAGLERTEDRMKYINEYSQRIRDRAATLLNGVQLGHFNDMQDAMLAQMRRREEQRKRT